MFFRFCLSLTFLAGIAAAQTTFSAVSGNNTSASSNFPGKSDTRTGVLNANYEPVPGNVSHLDTHDLVFPGFKGKILVNFLNWFSTSANCTTSDAGLCGQGPLRETCNTFMLTDYNSNDLNQVHDQMNDVAARHFDGAMITYEANTPTGIEDGAMRAVRDDLNARCSSSGCPLQFAVLTDGSELFRTPGFAGAAACPTQTNPISCTTSPIQPPPATNENCLIAHLKDDFCYLNQTFFGAPSYLKVNGHPVWQGFINESGWNLPLTGAAPSWQDLWVHMQDFVSNLPANCPAFSSRYAGATSNGVPDLEFENNGGFNQDGQSSNSQGAFAWIHPGNGVSGQTTAVTNDLNSLKSFYQTAQINPGKNAWGAAFAGFNDVMAGWSPPPPAGQPLTAGGRLEDNGCGRTWLKTLAAAAPFAPAFMQAVTWSDYDEGTEIETGIDNCVSSVTAAMGTSALANTLTWTVNFSTRVDGSTGDDSTIDRFNIYDSQDGETLTLAAALCNPGGTAANSDHLCSATGSPTRSIDLKNLITSVGMHKLFVQAVGKPSILNHITTQAVNYVPVRVTVTSQTTGSAGATVTVAANASSAATMSGWAIYVNNTQRFNTGAANSISASVPLQSGTNTIVVRAWNTTGFFGDETFTLTH
ncbi:MAG TPA: hypothetical protein VKY85_27550 [Candidatus Angelobacter sp.]|nr:hypothetical protein [Candidatus Angelobacter sp.]